MKHKLFFFFLFSGFFLFSCRKPQCEETVPVIAFKAFQQYRDAQGNLRDTAKIIITFKDCDGDIGLAENDTLPPYDTAGKYYHNFVLDYHEMVNGAWVKRNLNPGFKYRLPLLVPEGQSKILEGEVGMSISPFYFDFTSADSDTIKFTVRLYDRKLNLSNEVETPMILTE